MKLPRAFMALTVAAYTALAVLLVLRLLRFPRRVAADMAEHARAPGFFTVVAGTCVLGTDLAVTGGLAGHRDDLVERYEPQYWSLAFPLAMYTTGTLRLGDELHVSSLATISRGFLWLAALVWLGVFVGMIRSFLGSSGQSPAEDA